MNTDHSMARAAFWPTLLLSLFWLTEGWTAVYCVVDFGGKRCRYPDLVSCQKAAGKKGSCVLNQERIAAPVGGSPFCLVENWRTTCIYRDLASCEKKAVHHRTSCIPNPNLTAPAITPTPGRDQGEDPPGDGNPWEKLAPNRPATEAKQPFGETPVPHPGFGGGSDYLPSPDYKPRPGYR